MAGKKVNRLIVPNIYSTNGIEPVTSVNGILPVNGEVTIPIPTVPTNISAFTNDAGYLTSATLDGYATQSWVQQQGYLTSIPSQYITDSELSTTLADYVTSSSLSTTLNSYATITSLSTETSDRRDADDSLQLQINDKYDASNPSGFISGISSSDVIAALGYTPYNNSNPNGYITSAALSGYVTDTDLSTTLANYAQTTDIPTVGNGIITINQGGVQKGTFTVNQGSNATINLDAGGGTVDQTYDGTSTNAQSGVAIAGAGFLQNTATGTDSITILGTATNHNNSVNIGHAALVSGNYACALGRSAQAVSESCAIGYQAKALDTSSIALGYYAKSSFYSVAIGGRTNATNSSIAIGSGAVVDANNAIQLGGGTNSTASSFKIGFNGTNNYTLLDGTTGLIPDARISSNIARVNDIPTVPTNISSFTNDSGYITGITSSDVTTALGYTPYNSTNPNGYITGINSFDVTSALGYTPYNSSNPDGYTTNVGTVTSVNNSQPDANGNVTLSIPTVPTNVSAFTNDSGYITGITSNDVTDALGYTPSDSGAFHAVALHLAEAVSVNGSTGVNYSLANYLPNDNYNYYVWVLAYGSGDATSGHTNNVTLASSIFGGSSVCRSINRTSASTLSSGTTVIPIGTDRILNLNRSTNWYGTATLYLRGYQRIGING